MSVWGIGSLWKPSIIINEPVVSPSSPWPQRACFRSASLAWIEAAPVGSPSRLILALECRHAQHAPLCTAACFLLRVPPIGLMGSLLRVPPIGLTESLFLATVILGF